MLVVFFFFKQKTAYEIGTGDWSSDVCSSDLTDKTLSKMVKVVFLFLCSLQCSNKLCHLFVCYFTAFGSTCVSTEECVDILLMSVCKSGQCKCVPGYYYMNSTVGCLPGKS